MRFVGPRLGDLENHPRDFRGLGVYGRRPLPPRSPCLWWSPVSEVVVLRSIIAMLLESGPVKIIWGSVGLPRESCSSRRILKDQDQEGKTCWALIFYPPQSTLGHAMAMKTAPERQGSEVPEPTRFQDGASQVGVPIF